MTVAQTESWQPEVVVIGSGIGGLATAARLVRHGVRVLVLEQHTVPGGSASYFTRAGYRFDVGASLLYGLGTEGTINFVAEALAEVGETVETRRDDVQIHYHLPDGMEICTHYDREHFLDELTSYFPQERAGIRAFYDAAMEAYRVMARVPLIALDDVPGLIRGVATAPWDALRMSQAALTTLGDLAKRHLQDVRLRRFIDIETFCWALTGAGATPLVNAALVFGDRHVNGVRYPLGGCSIIAEKLAAGIERHGGRIRYGSRVTAGLVRQGRVQGVRLATGEDITARAVVSNATVWDTYGRLFREHPLAGVMFREQSLRYAQADSFTSLFGGVASPHLPAETVVHHIVVNDWEAYDKPRGMLFVSLPSLHDASLAPPGYHNVHAFMVDRYDDWSALTQLAAGGGGLRRTPAYRAAKEAAARHMLHMLERVIPNASEAVQVVSVGTPLTNERYLARNRGTYGPLLRRGPDVLLKPQGGSPIRGLYCAGDSCFPGQGVPSVAASGLSCAGRILRAW
ncbi:NAD(P)/FAD-dependent oxidoreductase [Chloracidobacterium thermophilum]|uniref:phytoene desaturase family protein n=1 Tax=Chloracidobacterium thermophilum TaxID=458033 RepID=UPI000738757F|nr:NAD(P)/FAD-dependent oxidoreductase [Chloracidobacterium thermophilum]